MAPPKNRNPCLSFFTTFPQWKVCEKQDLFDILEQAIDTEYLMLAEETHEDGNPHFHSIFKLKAKQTYKHIIDLLKNEFPDDYKRIDVQPLKNWNQSIDYLCKEDANPLETGDKPVKMFNSAKQKRHLQRVAEVDEWLKASYQLFPDTPIEI